MCRPTIQDRPVTQKTGDPAEYRLLHDNIIFPSSLFFLKKKNPIFTVEERVHKMPKAGSKTKQPCKSSKGLLAGPNKSDGESGKAELCTMAELFNHNSI